MISINLKKITQYLLKAIKMASLVIGLAIIAIICYIIGYLLTDEEGWCLSEGHGVWDADRQECRQDCLTWRKDIGCVPITEDNIRKKEKGLL